MRYIIQISFFLLYFTLNLEGQVISNCDGSDAKILLVGDSWAQYMGDDGVHTDILNQYGQGDKYLETETLGSSPSVPYTGSAYAISGSEAREWADTDTYPYIQNMVTALNDNPEIELVVLSIGGNDVLAGKSDGGWYKDMDLDVPNSEAMLFSTIEANTLAVINAALNVRPSIRVLLSSYEYPNFDVEFGTCWIYACDKREDLSRDPVNDLITNAELNNMMLITEAQRQAMVDGLSRVYYDNGIGLMHYIYGNASALPGVLPKPLGVSPYTPGGNPQLPTLRENFRIWGDPIHLDAEAYEYKVKNQMDNYIFDSFRGQPDITLFSEGGANDGWVDIISNDFGTTGIKMGDDGIFGASSNWRSILSFDTSVLPDNASVTGASIYLHRSGEGAGSNPFSLSDFTPMVDIKNGTFGNAGVELNDGTSSADATNAGCFHGDVDENYHVTRIDIHPSYLQHFNNTGRTQFRIYFDEADFSPNYVNYFDGDQNGFTSNGVEKSGLDKEPLIYQEKIIQNVEPDGTVTEQLIVVAAVSHTGLSELLGTTAPFLDLSYDLMSVLPVDLLAFIVKAVEEEAHLEWESSHEQNFLGYHIERSNNGHSWEKIDFLAGKGEREEPHAYSTIDSHPFKGDNFYRLAMEDIDGSIEYSDIHKLVFDTKLEEIITFPNPFVNDLTLRFERPTETPLNIELVDALGRSLAYWTFNEIGLNNIELAFESTIPSGNYWLKVQGDEKVISLRISKI